MITFVDRWLAFLNGADPLAGVPLLAGGLVLLLFGWRLWKICVVLSFGLIGAALGASFAPPSDSAWVYSLVAAVLLGALSYWPARYAIAVLGGLIGGGLVAQVGAGAGLTGTTFWLVTAVGFIGALALAFINRRYVVISVTAILGAGLMMSGLTVFAQLSPGLHWHISSMARNSSIVLPFLLLVPAVVGYCYQSGDTSRSASDL